MGALAQSIKVNPTKVTVADGEGFRITYEIISGSVDNFTPPNFKDFDVIGGPNSAQSFSYINGKTQSKSSISYVLRNKKRGIFKIPHQMIIDLSGRTN